MTPALPYAQTPTPLGSAAMLAGAAGSRMLDKVIWMAE